MGNNTNLRNSTRVGAARLFAAVAAARAIHPSEGDEQCEEIDSLTRERAAWTSPAVRPSSKNESHALGQALLQRQAHSSGGVSCPPQWVPVVLAMLLPPPPSAAAKTEAAAEVEAEAKARIVKPYRGPSHQADLIRIRAQPSPDSKEYAASSVDPVLSPLLFIAKGYEVITSTAWQVSCALLCAPLLLSAITSNGMVISTRRSPPAWLAHSLQALHRPPFAPFPPRKSSPSTCADPAL
eukprot:scaffold17877_cov66-Phaeocystis_antarctica.AAC.6